MSGKEKADDAVKFFARRLKHTKGRFAGQPFVLAPWQEKIVRAIFGTLKSNGMRQYNTAYVEVPKKNGKSELGAGIALAGLLLDEEPGAEVYSAASTREQASIVFRIAAQMIRSDHVLSSMCHIVDSIKTIYLKNDPSSFYKAISADAGVHDGINPHVVVFDELHRQTNTDLWDILRYGSSVRQQPLLFAITTAGVIGQSPVCEEQHEYARRLLEGSFTDPTYYPVIYGLDAEEDWLDEGHPEGPGKPATGWYKANPALGDFLSIERVREEARNALNFPSQQNSFRRFRLNQWVGQESRFIPMDAWAQCAAPLDPQDLVGKPCFGGLDLSSTRDFTAFALVFPTAGEYYVLVYLFLPAENIRERERADNVPYAMWAAQGYIHLTPGNEVDYGYIYKTISQLWKSYNIREVGYDRWNATSLVRQLSDEGLTMVPIGQGFQSMNAPTAELLHLVKLRKLRHNNNPALNWMADCMTVKHDPAGNLKPDKTDRMRKKKRIDGIVAIINALARAIVAPEYRDSVYLERPKFLQL